MSFIFLQGRRQMKRHRLVNELYLDWIFNCINRDKIYNIVGGSVTHTQTTFKINKQKKYYRPGARQKLELASDVLG